MGEAGQARVVDAAEFAIEIGGLHVQGPQRRDGAWIFAGPVKAGPGEQLHAAVVDACGHAIAVKLDLMNPLWPGRRVLDRLRKLERDEWRNR
jgi:hypothetical protein